MTVTVAMPFYRCGEWVERAVRSVLAQTYRDIHLVVIGDGEAPALDISDPRLETYVLPENHGTYFGLQLVLQATSHRWIAPFASDDWAEPDHLARLVALSRTGAVKTGRVYWEQASRTRVHPAPGKPPSAYEVGLFSVARLRAIGGWNPAERIGQDSLTMRLLGLNGAWAVQDVPTYHRVRRADSLTTAAETGLRSDARREVRIRNRAVYLACRALRDPARVRAYREDLVPGDVREALAFHVAALSAQLAGRAAA